MSLLGTAATLAAAVTTGLTGGAYLAFTVMVLPALDGAAASDAIATMQRVNVAAVRPPFMIVFFGSVLTAVAAAVSTLAAGDPTGTRALRLAGAGLAVGAFVITVAVNVPLNDGLAAIPPGTPDASGAWAQYSRSWGGANLIRGLVSVAGCAALVASITSGRS